VEWFFRWGFLSQVEKLESAIARLETHIRNKEPTIKKVFLEPILLNPADEEPPHQKYQ
jgi:hypothetical protein